jgi:hypothetical protein
MYFKIFKKSNSRLLKSGCILLVALLCSSPLHADEHIDSGNSEYLYSINAQAAAETAVWINSPAYKINYSDLKKFKRPLLNAGITATGAGLSLIAASVPLFVLHNDCASTDVNSNGQCESLHNSKPAGIILISSGISIMTAGIIMIMARAIKKRKYLKRYGGN